MAAPMQYGSNTPAVQPPKPPVPGGIGSSPTSMQSAAPQEEVIRRPEESMVLSVKKLFRSLAAKKKSGETK